MWKINMIQMKKFMKQRLTDIEIRLVIAKVEGV